MCAGATGAGSRVKFAYADPPYIGQAHKYKDHPDYAGEVDHSELINTLVVEYPDGWALSCSSPSLGYLLQRCWTLVPEYERIRVAAWVKPFAVFKPNVGVAYAWEPVIFFGGRKRTREQPTVPDWVSANITLKRGLVGVKPDEFCFWLFSILNMEYDDEFHDLFPGSGAVTKAWNMWRRQTKLAV